MITETQLLITFLHVWCLHYIVTFYSIISIIICKVLQYLEKNI